MAPHMNKSGHVSELRVGQSFLVQLPLKGLFNRGLDSSSLEFRGAFRIFPKFKGLLPLEHTHNPILLMIPLHKMGILF